MSCFCNADITLENKQTVKKVLSGLDDSRMRINSGICQITGNSFADNESFRDNIIVAFDYNKGFYRFDRDEDKRSLKTPDYYYEHLKSRQMVTRQKSQEQSPSFLIKPFDIRNLGFFTFVGPYWEREYAKNEHEELFEDEPISLEKSTNGVFIVTVKRTPKILGFPPFLRRYWVDSHQGFSMIRAEYGCADVVEISWKEVNKTWIPTSFSLRSARQNQSAEWTINWLLVNESVPEDYFDPTLLSEEATLLVSRELEQSVIIGNIGKGLPLPNSEKLDFERVHQKFYYFRYFLVLSGLVLIFISLGKKIYDWKIKRSK
jgi:hypothetical protein